MCDVVLASITEPVALIGYLSLLPRSHWSKPTKSLIPRAKVDTVTGHLKIVIFQTCDWLVVFFAESDWLKLKNRKTDTMDDLGSF